ncbi:hormogonium polysaccharide secretion pseudopilin HpsC [Halotia branconii]|uniref:Hormogonium polysaccharide secretion pseudopilin HpsC n=1 Tax=Halotia branconii CENA392 TaxID=1539056 RepID=A0AAJ6PBG0_9CYAN|nr:hormogonium polysaccharide secretion pseudopilin HpsC [Halotia branconii]WGV27762.1 hormogonium polysaccharide secretion pseudopilin HpsC [Halotia branconii CENA392]
MNILRWLLNVQLKISQKQNKNSGFTLIELLVALILAFLVITPLLGFMISVLNTDRQEQAKVTSEQEIKSALDYIARDLQQALYIYDDTTTTTGIVSKIPAVTDGAPVLVFWKREFAKESAETKNSGGVVQFKDDSFVYSLVAYYLIKDTNTTWSQAARIARWQIKDGVTNATGRSDCPGFTASTDEKYSQCPDKGFKPFDLSAKDKTLKQKMDSWTNSLAAGENYTQVPVVLVDFIDQTTTTQGAPGTTCSTGFTTIASGVRTGFYACVKSPSADTDNRSTAEVYLRGNAQARLIQNDETKIRYAQNKSSYFPSGNIKVQGRSFVFTK